MMKKWIPIVGVSALVGLMALSAYGTEGQDPDGEPPQGFAFSEDSPGARVSGVSVSIFRGIPVCAVTGAPRLESILRVRKAGTLAAFSHVLTCSSACPASPCEEFPACGAGVMLVSQTKIAEIQACLLQDLGPAIGQAVFGDPNADVRLKNVEEFVLAPPIPEDANSFTQAAVADVELSVK